jgi:hypothetical protein
MNIEPLFKALDSAKFATRELQDALKSAGAVEALVILPLIADAARLQQQISGLITAMQSE